ncbi:RNA polymerase sigma-70 factor [Pseudopedobacter sp.]|uniref:RNA polymerase sigma-70 factor n=1 Tax=Pseudopedobacter sp. TaxID=1936787 RepID=UPI00334083AA
MDISSAFLRVEEVESQEVDIKSLFDTLYDRLVYFSYQIIRNQEQAEDIVQEAFVKLWGNKETLVNSEQSLKSYLYNTVKNLSLNVIRHSKVVDRYMQLNLRGDEPMDAPIVEAIMSAEVLSQIHKAVADLPQQYKTISLLSFFEGKKNQEIADELGISVNTIKKQKQKAIQMLRLKLTSLLSLMLAFFLSL